MGNFEKLSVLVIVVIIVMILVVALYTWTDDPEKSPETASGGAAGSASAGAEELALLNREGKGGTYTPVSPPGGAKPKVPGPAADAEWPEDPWRDPEADAPKSTGRKGTPSPVVNEVLDPIDPPTPVPAPAPPKSADPVEGPWEYTVQAGDTLSQICERELGTWRRQNEVSDLNAGLDPLRLRAGEKLKMPPRARASSVKVDGGTGPSVASAPKGSIPLGDWYVLQSGDRMANIAKRAYGSIDRWPELWARNVKAVPDPDAVQAGTRIFIPK